MAAAASAPARREDIGASPSLPRDGSTRGTETCEPCHFLAGNGNHHVTTQRPGPRSASSYSSTENSLGAENGEPLAEVELIVQ